MIKKTLYIFVVLTLSFSCTSLEETTVDKRQDTMKAVKKQDNTSGKTDSKGEIVR